MSYIFLDLNGKTLAMTLICQVKRGLTPFAQKGSDPFLPNIKTKHHVKK